MALLALFEPGPGGGVGNICRLHLRLQHIVKEGAFVQIASDPAKNIAISLIAQHQMVVSVPYGNAFVEFIQHGMQQLGSGCRFRRDGLVGLLHNEPAQGQCGGGGQQQPRNAE